MITLIYRGIIALVVLLVLWNLYTDKKVTNQLNCALVLIPMVLRLLMIK